MVPKHRYTVTITFVSSEKLTDEDIAAIETEFFSGFASDEAVGVVAINIRHSETAEA